MESAKDHAPDGQLWQVEMLVAATVLEYVPLLHTVHIDAPVLEYEPAQHWAQNVLPVAEE